MTTAAYDALAPDYAAYARTRAAYCNSVDRQILAWRPATTRALLDVGSGDGSRAVRLAAALGAARIVLSDPSEPMANQCRIHTVADVWQCPAEDLPAGDAEFDVVTSLWNVLGHVDGNVRRAEALRRMASRLAPGGRLFLDVHNRYNAATAGRKRVALRVFRDWVFPSATNGAVSFAWDVAGHRIQATGYLFAPTEMRSLIATAGLRIVDQAWVDYISGEWAGPWSGQMLFALART